MNLNVVLSVFRRNFANYFTNPTGYVFICLFVFLCSLAAFVPNEFFNSNLANLDQLNRWLPFILLVFIPAITMSIWAEERRQGTDELLLTLPATDLDIVLGKYLAAVAIYTTALLYSLASSLIIFYAFLGYPDPGLFAATALGYWLVGLAMLAIGMVASFLTSNITVGFVLGSVFNAPLVLAAFSDALLPQEAYLSVREWSISDQLQDFSRGVISLDSVIYFLAIVGVMLFLSMVLMGRRHWIGGPHSSLMSLEYLAQTLGLVGAGMGLVVLTAWLGWRADVTQERLTSLAPDTVRLIRELQPKNPVVVHAYVSPTLPESYIQTKLNLLSVLRELEAVGRNKIIVQVHQTEPLSEEAERAEQQFGITPRNVVSRASGQVKLEEIFLGVALTSGLDKIVVPFVDRGTPIEYELTRSICSVAQEKKKKLGVVLTEAQLFGDLSNPMAMFGGQSQREMIIDELEKQYDVQQINLEQPLRDALDVLLVVQPSSLSEEQIKHLVEAIQAGQPTAIFEDPFPFLRGNITASAAPRNITPQQQQMAMMGMPPPGPKGNIETLWNQLGIAFSRDEVTRQPVQVVWQNYNPYPRFPEFPPEFVFVDAGLADASQSGEEVFNSANPVTSKLQQLLFLCPGWVSPVKGSPLEFRPLVQTGDKTGIVQYQDIRDPSSPPGQVWFNTRRRRMPTNAEYVLAAEIVGPAAQPVTKTDAAQPPPAESGTPAAASEGTQPATGEAAPPATAAAAATATAAGTGTAQETAAAAGTAPAETPAPPEAAPASPPRGIHVIFVTDIDCLFSDFFMLQQQGENPDRELNLRLDNVPFVLNVLDVLAGDQRFVEIRKRRRVHRTLAKLEEQNERAVEKAMNERDRVNSEFRAALAAEEAKIKAEEQRLQSLTGVKDEDKAQRLAWAAVDGQRRLEVTRSQLERKLEKQTKDIEQDLVRQTRQVQNRVKTFALFAPLWLPLIVGVIEFFKRRSAEYEGVSKQRLR